MNILVTAYACDPQGGSEPGYGWNWPQHLAKSGHSVTVIVPSRWRGAVEAELDGRQRDNLSFVYVDQNQWPLLLGWSLGSAVQYLMWQWKAAAVAARLDRHEDFDVMHHVSYGSLLGGSFLWRVGKPLVFGPVGGGQTAPCEFSRYFGDAWRTEALRNTVVRYLAPAFVWSRACLRRSLVVASNRETELLARRLGARQVVRMLDVGLPECFFPVSIPERPLRSHLRVLWTGRLMPRKAVRMALEAVASMSGSARVELVIVGDGPQGAYLGRWIDELGLKDRVTWRGELPWVEVATEYANADVFLFTSLRDSGGVQVLEAMAYGLPIVTLDHQGAAEMVPGSAGIRVPVTRPETTVSELAGALQLLAESPERRTKMGQAAFDFAKEYSWPAKVLQVNRAYSALAPEAVQHHGEEAGQVKWRPTRTKKGSRDAT